MTTGRFLFSSAIIVVAVLVVDGHVHRSAQEISILDKLAAMRNDIVSSQYELRRLSAVTADLAARRQAFIYTDSGDGVPESGDLAGLPAQDATGRPSPSNDTAAPETRTLVEQAAYTPEQETAFHELSTRIYSDLASQAITLPEILRLPEFSELPITLKRQLISGILLKINTGQLDASRVWPKEP